MPLDGDIPNLATRRISSPRTGVGVAVCALAAAWFAGAASAAEPTRGERTASRPWAVSITVAAPLASVTFTAPPMVTAPAETVARFSISPLPLVATVVTACRIDQVMISRLGGRHGP